MDELRLLDNEEIFLLVGSISSLLFTCSFILTFLKVYQRSLNYIDSPIISISFCYINNLIWYFYSDLIFHDLMKLCYLISIFISLSLIIFYLIYEYKQDKFDCSLNFLLIIGITLALHKLLKKVYNDEDKVKISCSYSTLILLFSIIEWLYRGFMSRSNKNLNIYTGISLFLTSVCYFIYGIVYKEIWFLLPNFFGIIFACSYIISFKKLSHNKYSTFQQNKGETVIDIEIKDLDDEQENKLKENESKENGKKV